MLTGIRSIQISGQTYGELRIVPDMHTRKVSPGVEHIQLTKKTGSEDKLSPQTLDDLAVS